MVIGDQFDLANDAGVEVGETLSRDPVLERRAAARKSVRPSISPAPAPARAVLIGVNAATSIAARTFIPHFDLLTRAS